MLDLIKKYMACLLALGLGLNLVACSNDKSDVKNVTSEVNTPDDRFRVIDPKILENYDYLYDISTIEKKENTDDRYYYYLGASNVYYCSNDNNYQYAVLKVKNKDVNMEQNALESVDLYDKGMKIVSEGNSDLLNNFDYLGVYNFDVPPKDDDSFHYVFVSSNVYDSDNGHYLYYHYAVFAKKEVTFKENGNSELVKVYSK